MLALLATVALLAADAPPASTDETRLAYQAAKAAAGRSPDDQVRLAYWCEAHGLSAERMRHLAQAVLADPNHAAARGLLGLVARQDRWMRPEAVTDQVKADAALAGTLAEYDAKRSATPYTADGQWTLANWADERGLHEQAKAHWTAVVRLDPKRDQAWKRLGFTKHDGRWATDAEIATAKADAEAQKAADRKWKPLLEKWKADLARPSHRAEAEANLLTVTDPRAVPSVGKVFGTHEADGPRVVPLLGQIDAPAASRALAYLAVYSSSADVRRVATETLRSLDAREYANLLIPLIRKPIKYEVKPVNGPGSPGVLFVEGEKANFKRLYEPKSLIQPTDRITTDRFGQPVVERVLSYVAQSKGGNPFNPGILTGLGTSYSDSFSSSFQSIGDVSTSIPYRSNQNNIGGVNSAVLMNGSFGELPKSPADLVAKIHSAQAGTNGKPHQVLVNSFGPGAVFLPGGLTVNARDTALFNSAQLPLDQMIAESNRSALVSQQQLSNDVAQIERTNQSTVAMNDRVVGTLNNATGEHLTADRNDWERWWVNLLGYAFVAGQTEVNPTFVEVIPSGYQPEVAPSNLVSRGLFVNGVSCFGAGTLVQTMTGPQPIERLKVGDLVLTQSTASGALGYHPITVTHHNPPAATFRVQLGDDTIVASHFHRFWVARQGWVMARDLKAGDPVRTLGGGRPVDAVEAGKVELVYNLDIADDADFFAGSSAALVHDNTLPDPRLVPFDLPAARAVAAR